MVANTLLEMVMAHDGEPWPLAITNYLLPVDHGALDQEYYGPFNTTLTHVFPFSDNYTVAPQTYPNRRGGADYLIELLELSGNQVVGGVEVKRESDIGDEHSRRASHSQALDRFRSMHGLVQVPVIVMVSAIGRHC